MFVEWCFYYINGYRTEGKYITPLKITLYMSWGLKVRDSKNKIWPKVIKKATNSAVIRKCTPMTKTG